MSDVSQDLKKLTISTINFGIVIDHIPEKRSFKISEILNLKDYSDSVAILSSVKSNGGGYKDIIKIEGKHLDIEEIDKIALLAPGVTINVIENSKVISKKLVSIPMKVNGLLKCFNPNCISNHETMETKFITENITPILIRCVYCERIFNDEIIRRMFI